MSKQYLIYDNKQRGYLSSNKKIEIIPEPASKITLIEVIDFFANAMIFTDIEEARAYASKRYNGAICDYSIRSADI